LLPVPVLVTCFPFLYPLPGTGTFFCIFSPLFLGKLSDITDRTKDVMEAAAKESSSKVISAYLQAALLINSQVFSLGRIPLDVSALLLY
jgi:hypothetical protein